MKEETTETIPKQECHIDKLNNEEALKIMLENHFKAFKAVKCAFNSIELSVNAIVSLLSNNYKLLNKRQINESLKLFNTYKSKH